MNLNIMQHAENSSIWRNLPFLPLLSHAVPWDAQSESNFVVEHIEKNVFNPLLRADYSHSSVKSLQNHLIVLLCKFTYAHCLNLPNHLVFFPSAKFHPCQFLWWTQSHNQQIWLSFHQNCIIKVSCAEYAGCCVCLFFQISCVLNEVVS